MSEFFLILQKFSLWCKEYSHEIWRKLPDFWLICINFYQPRGSITPLPSHSNKFWTIQSQILDCQDLTNILDFDHGVHLTHMFWTVFSVHSSPKEMHIDFAQFSRWPWVTDPVAGSCRFCQMVLTAICKRPQRRLSRPIDKIKMTRGRGRWPRDLRKLGWFSCALLLEKNVVSETPEYLEQKLVMK